MTAPPGWYPFTQGEGEVRYWDGKKWAEEDESTYDELKAIREKNTTITKNGWERRTHRDGSVTLTKKRKVLGGESTTVITPPNAAGKRAWVMIIGFLIFFTLLIVFVPDDQDREEARARELTPKIEAPQPNSPEPRF